jgi:predicted permease
MAGTIREWVLRMWATLRRHRTDADLEEELKAHLAFAAEDARRSGKALNEADRAARLRAGGLSQALDALRDQRGLPLVDAALSDLRYAMRALIKRPLMSVTAIVSIACSLGPATAVLGIGEALFFKPLPGIARQDRLAIYFFGTQVTRGIAPFSISYANALDVTRGATTIAAMAGFQDLPGSALAVPNAEPRLTSGAAVSANYFDVLGVRLVAGRTFRAEEDRTPGGEPVVVLSERRARDFFGSAEAAVGRTVLVNSVPFTVIGVALGSFAGTDAESHQDFWIPGMAYVRATHFPPEQWAYLSSRPFYAFIVRMAGSATVEQTTAELTARVLALAAKDPRRSARAQTVGAMLQPGFAAPATTRPAALRAVQLMAGVAALLVLLGMANVANLLLFRGVAGARDVATRKMLGASTRRLVQLRLVESLMLALAGAVAGVGVALALGELFSGFAVPALGSINVVMDWRVLTATACLSILVGAGFGLAPALLAARSSIAGTLGRGARAELPRATRLRHTLAASQIALSLALLVGALLFLSTVRNLHAVDLGFDPSGVVVVPLNLRVHGYSTARALDYEQRLSDALRHEPGVQSVALASEAPLFGRPIGLDVYLPGADPKTATEIPVNAVDSEYFRTLNLPLVRGRALTHDEAFGATPDAPSDEEAVLLSETLARALFGSSDVVGRRLLMPRYQAAPWTLRIVGVARQAHFGAVDEPPDPVLYAPLTHFPPNHRFLLVRSTFTQEGARRVIARAAAAIDPAVPVAPDRTFAAIIDQRLGQQRLFAWLLGLLASIAFLLSGVGLHGLLAQTVTERRHEFGIRLAIGADPMRIMRSVLRQAAILSASGLVVGLALAWIFGRVVESRLFGITSRDPAIYSVAAFTMMLVIAVATFIPARAATRVNPVDVLKQE